MITRKNLAVLITALSLCAAFFSPITAASAATPSALSVPKNLKVTRVSTTSVKVTFSRVQRTNSYTIYLYAANGKSLARKPIANFKPGRKITGLKKGAQYWVSVAAISKSVRFKNSARSKKVKFKAVSPTPTVTPTPSPVATPTSSPTPTPTPVATPSATPTPSPTATPTPTVTPTPTPTPTRSPDTTAPVISGETVTAVSTTSATLNFTTGEVGTAFYLVYASATAAPGAATIIAQGTVGGSIIALGSAAATLGSNTASITGLSAGTTYKAYLVIRDAALNTSEISTITFITTASPPAASTDARLSALSLSSGSLVPGFDSATISYTASVANGVDSITAIAIVNESNATFTINAAAETSTVASRNLALNVGENTVTILVTAQDGTTTKTYTITVTRAEATPSPDTLAPVLSSESATAITETSTVLSFTTSETGTAFYLVYASATAAPGAATIIAQGTVGGSIIALGSAAATLGSNTASITGLSAGTNYKAYLVIRDAALNTSEISTITFITSSVPGPAFTLTRTAESVSRRGSPSGPVAISSDSQITGYAISPDLPIGLVFDTLTAAITGNANTKQALQIYTITASYASGEIATAEYSLTVTGANCSGLTFDCLIGDIGPGGGTVFYVAPTYFTETGTACSTTCKYLETAPTDTATVNFWANGTYAWSGNTNTFIGTTGSGIGAGYSNTLAIIAQSDTPNMAATASHSYGGPNNLTDWFLPSRLELLQLYYAASSVPGFTGPYYYWTSTEDSVTTATQLEAFYGFSNSALKSILYKVRPIRAFGPTPPPAPPAFTLSHSSETATVGNPIVGFTANSTGGAIESYSIAQTLFAGLIFDTSTGTLSGTPTETGKIKFTVTATNATGSTTQDFELSVFGALPIFASLSPTSKVKGVTLASLGTPATDSAILGSFEMMNSWNKGSVTLTPEQANDVSGLSESATSFIASYPESATVFYVFKVDSTTDFSLEPSLFTDTQTITSGDLLVVLTALNDFSFGYFYIIGVTVSSPPPPTPDTLAPVLSSESATAITETCTVLSFTTSETGTAYYLVYESATAAPDTATILTHTGGVASGFESVTVGSKTISITGLTANTSYKAYLVVQDAALNTSIISIISFTTTGVVAPCYVLAGNVIIDGSACTGALTIPRTVTQIGISAFESSTITSLSFESGSALETISARAFYQLALQGSLQIPASVKTIGESAFQRTNLTSLSFETGSVIELVDLYAFVHSFDLTGPITIPASLREVRDYAFYNTRFTCVRNLSGTNVSGLKGLGGVPACAPWTFVSTSTPTIVVSGLSTSLETATVGILLSAYNYETTTPSGAAFTFQWESSTVLDGSYSAISDATYETFTATSDLLGNFLRVKVKANAVGYTETSTASVGIPVSAAVIATCYVVDGTTIIDGSGCSGALTIGNDVTAIGNWAFYINTSITSLNFAPTSIMETIGAGAFYGATSLTGTLTIPASVRAIESQAFYGDSFTSLVFETPTVLEFIGDNAFRYNSLLTGTLTIPRSVRILDLAAFEFTAITALNFETSSALETIGESAFHGTPNLAGTATIPKSVKSIGTYAFMESGISSLVFEADSELETISVQAFDQNPTLVGSLTIPASVKTIGDSAFRSSAITSLTFGANSSLQYIGNGAFVGISTLGETLTIPASVTDIGAGAFTGTNFTCLNYSGSALLAGTGLQGLLACNQTNLTVSYSRGNAPALKSLQFNGSNYLGNNNMGRSNSFSPVISSPPGTGAFTYEMWFKLSNLSQFSVIFSTRIPQVQGYIDAGIRAGVDTAGRLEVDYKNIYLLLSDTGTINTDTWYFLTVQRDGNQDWQFFLDGIAIANYEYSTGLLRTTPVNDSINLSSNNLVLGAHAGGTGLSWAGESPMTGYISEFRYTKAALYSGDFSPPTSRLEAVAETQFLLGTLNDATFPADQIQHQLLFNYGSVDVSTVVPPINVPVDSATYSAGNNVNLPLAAPYWNGHTFLGWSDGESMTSTSDSFYTISITETSNVVLTAQWSPNTYNLIWNVGQGTLSGITQDTYTVGQSIQLAQAPTLDGSVFRYWNLKPDGSGESLTPEYLSNIGFGDKTFYAIFAANTITWINFADMGSLINGPTTYIPGQSIGNLPADPISDGSWIFNGWITYSPGGIPTTIDQDYIPPYPYGPILIEADIMYID